MGSVRVAIVGVGNCASSLVQGVTYYRNADASASVPGLMHVQFGPYHVSDVQFVAAFDVDHHADLRPAMNVLLELALGRQAHEAADRHVLADLSDQCRAHLLHRLAVDLQRRQRRDIGRVLRRHEFGQFGRKCQKIVVLGHEVGFTVDLDHRAQFAVRRHPGRNHTFGRHACRGLGRLVAKFDAQDFFSLGQIAGSLRQRLLAFHHWRVGLLAQFLDHRSGDFRHVHS
jgi:hypothetical protein